MSGKRAYIDLDPDYEDVSERQSKRRKVMEEDAKAATKRKIESIIKKQFDLEIEAKESELLVISEKLELARSMMDRLRACIVANFYANANQQKTTSKKSSEQSPMIHPTVRKFIGKAPPGTPHTPEVPVTSHSKQVLESEKIGKMVMQVQETVQQQPCVRESSEKETGGSRPGRFKVKKRIIVGNLSKSIPADQRDDNDQATHKWMVYVRGSKECPNINGFVKKVWFFLHPSYRPNDLVEVSQPPFHLTRRGWGEFPVRVQIHFKDSRNKRVDIIHNLKLDRTYTGLQTLGTETVVDVEIERDMTEVKQERKQKGEGRSRQAALQHPPDIKQEPVDQGYNCAEKSQIPCQTYPLLKEIKLEPVDHDYGRTSCLSSLGSLNSQQKVKKEIESQVGSGGQSVCNTLGLGSILSTCVQTIGSPTVITTQAMSILTTISQTHNHLAVISSSPSKQQILSNSGNIMLTSPPGNLVLKAVGPVTPMASNISTSGVNLKLLDSVKTGSQSTVNLTLNQSVVQAGLQVNKSQTVQQNRIPLNQSSNSGLVFLKCTDNQGKTFLIPQQINNTLTSPTKGVNMAGGIKTGSTNNRPILLTGGLPVSNIANLAIPGSVNKVQGKQFVQTLVRSPNSASTSNRPQKSALQNGPVFFIKPDSVNRTPLTVKTSNISSTITNTTPVKVNSNLQIVQNCSQKQSTEVLCVKPVNQSITSPENQSMNKGQLKVTPQGLIQVQGQNVSPGLGLTASTIDKNLQSSGAKPKQPIVLIPSNGKVTLLPGKGKSLLNSVSNTLSSSASGNNPIILLNQSMSPVGNGNVVCVTPSSAANQNKSVSMINKSDMFVLQTKQTKPGVSTPNHVVIIPVSSEQSSTVVSTSSLNSLTSVVMTTTKSIVNSNVSSTANSVENKNGDKTMFIVVQNDKKPVAANLSNDPLKSSSASLLTCLPSDASSVTSKLSNSADQITQVTVSASNARSKQILLVNHNEDRGDGKTTYNTEDRKCIMDPKKKRQKIISVKEFIQPMCMKDYPDLLSVIRASVTRHPLVSEQAGRNLHPYCACNNEDWLSWNVGKRRASEWQRASCVRKYIISALDGSTEYKGTSLWTTKQILVWCRLHAYSPHYLERPLHPTGIDLQAETSLTADKHRKKFYSFSGVKEIHEDLTNIKHLTASFDGTEEEVDILNDSPTKIKIAEADTEKEDTDVGTPESLPLLNGALFVEEMAKQIGVKLQQTEVDPGYFGTLSHGLLYKSMENFMSDIIRETFAVQVNTGRYPDTLSVGDVFTALKNLNTTDFLTNKYLGVEENVSVPTAPT